MIPGKRYTPELILAIAWRRKWLIAIPSVLVAIVACGITYMLPDKYKSETAILVVPQRVPENYVRSSVTTKIEDRLRTINQQVRSRTRLERTIEDFNLYADRRKRDIMQDIVDDMSADIQVEIVQGDVFKISYTSDNPRTAMQVTERLGTFFIDESLKDRTLLAENTSEFLETQVADAARKLRETEQKIADFKRQHDGELPDQFDTNLQGMQNAQIQLATVGAQIDRDRDLQLTLQRKLQDQQELADAAAAAPAPVLEPDAPQTKAAQLAAANAQMKVVQLKYGPGFPAYDNLKAAITRLEREAAEEAASRTTLSPQQPTLSPLLARRLQDVANTRNDLDAANRQFERHQADQKRLTGVIGEYQRRMELAPVRNSELIELTRDYGSQKQSYESLSTKKMDSTVSANLERRQMAEQFRILDPARLPEKPSSPNRPSLYLIGLALALAVGVGAAGTAEYLDRGLRSEDDVRLALALPVLATIPVIGPKKKMSFRRKLIAGSAAAALVVTAVGAAWFVLR